MGKQLTAFRWILLPSWELRCAGLLCSE